MKKMVVGIHKERVASHQGCVCPTRLCRHDRDKWAGREQAEEEEGQLHLLHQVREGKQEEILHESRQCRNQVLHYQEVTSFVWLTVLSKTLVKKLVCFCLKLLCLLFC